MRYSHAFALLLATATAHPLAAEAPAVATGTARELAPGVYFVPGEFVPGRQPDGNSVLFRAPEGLVVVDTGRHRAHTQKLLDFAASAGLVPKMVVNTHWHLDHIGGNAYFRDQVPGLRILASAALAGARKGFLADYHASLEAEIPRHPDQPELQAQWRAELALIDAGPRLEPDEVVTGSGTRSLAGLAIDVHLETHAVTAGDVWLLDPATGILTTRSRRRRGARRCRSGSARTCGPSSSPGV